jgi:tetratricopeptide (TPR) repeat protein
VVLRPGERRAFVGEAAHLRELRLRFERAVDAGRHAEAAEAGARFLRAARSPAQAADVQVQLAAVLQRLGRTDESADLYRAAARSAASALTRQNAQAFLARLEAERGRAAAAEAAWRALRQAFPGGIYDREALLALARLGCSRRDAAATADRRELATRFGGQPEVRALLARCPGPDVAP